MKAGERDRVGALRMVLSELQKDAQGGRRRRGGGAAPRAQAPPRGGRAVPRRRTRRAGRAEEAEAALIEHLSAGRAVRRGARAIVAAAIAATGAEAPKDMGKVMGAVMAEGRGPRRRQAGHAAGCRGPCNRSEAPGRARQRGRRRARGHARTPSCARWRAISTVTSSCAATWSRSKATTPAVESGVQVVREMSRADRAGPRDRARNDRRRQRRARRSTSRRQRSSRTSSGVTARRRSPQDGQPEALRRLDPPQHGHLRRSARPAPARPSSRSRWPRPRSTRREVNRIILTRPAVEAGERLGFLPGDLMAKVDPYLRPLFDALHDMLDPERVSQYSSAA